MVYYLLTRIVGIYSVAVKIYSVVKQLLNATIVVAIPRLAYYNSKKNNKLFIELSSKILNVCVFLILPIITLLFLLSDNIIILLSTQNYIEASSALRVLVFGLIFAVFANLFCNGILIIKEQEKFVLKGTIIAAITNIALNFIFISLWKQNGSALTTVIAEFIVMLYSYYHANKYMEINGFISNFLKELLGCFFIVLLYLCLYKYLIILNSNFIQILLFGIFGSIIYILLEFILKNEIENEFIKQLLNKLKNKERKL